MKNITKTILTVSIAIICGSVAHADGNAFTPLDFSSTAQPAKTTAAMPDTAKAPSTVDLSAGEVPVGNENIQSAILELDNAQVGIRNDLLNYKAKYADVDAQYKLVKNEREMLAKQFKAIEKRIKNIDKAKEKIRKNML